MFEHPKELGPIHQYPILALELPIIGALDVEPVPEPGLYSDINVVPSHLI
jgi:hypothetical protein